MGQKEREHRMKLLRNLIGNNHKTQSAAQSRLAVVAGLEGLAKRLNRECEPTLAAVVTEHLETCKELLRQYDELSPVVAKGYKKPLQELATETAVKLEKLLPKGVFKNTESAADWVIANMPLEAARTEEGNNIFRYSEEVGKLRDISNKLFACFYKACSDATGQPEGYNTVFSDSILRNGLDRL
jgi:hypothetical protein